MEIIRRSKYFSETYMQNRVVGILHKNLNLLLFYVNSVLVYTAPPVGDFYGWIEHVHFVRVNDNGTI